MKYRFIIPVLIFFCVGSFTSCKEPESTGPENRTDSLMLKVKETDLTSATLSLHTAGITYPASMRLTRNSQPVQTFSLHQPDTTLIDTALTPSTTYTWQAIWKKTETTFLKGETVTGRTMDSTSHEFTWQIDTLGARGSILRDVVIVNDTCVWVVGEINVIDNDTGDRYNAAMWNGKVWKKYRILLPDWADDFSAMLINCIWYDGTGLWVFSNVGSYAKFKIDGEVLFTGKTLARKGTPKKIWGYSPDRFYLVGTGGSLTWYDGKDFHLLETGTTIDLLDIWGLNENEVWACGYIHNTGVSTIVRIKNRIAETVKNQLPGNLILMSSVFSVRNNEMLLSAEGRIYRFQTEHPEKLKVELIGKSPLYMKALGYRIRGRENDLWVAGVRGALWHFNGSSWHSNEQFYGQIREWKSLDYSPRLVVAAGYDYLNGDNGYVMIGKINR
ncbi:MAG: hypothetical protein J0L62_06450 [Bacteroidetes bacterium]|nr:hypothetical protein [Bacteroidota bacterium]